MAPTIRQHGCALVKAHRGAVEDDQGRPIANARTSTSIPLSPFARMPGCGLRLKLPSSGFGASPLPREAHRHRTTMEMTDQRERASAPVYRQSRVRPVTRISRTEHEGTSAATQRRHERKRADTSDPARSPRSLAFGAAVQQEGQNIARAADNQNSTRLRRCLGPSACWPRGPVSQRLPRRAAPILPLNSHTIREPPTPATMMADAC